MPVVPLRASTESKCLHGGFKVQIGHLPLFAKVPFMLAAFIFISAIRLL